MLETDKVFAGSIPENYDRYLVPLIFERFAAALARRAASLAPSAVLETVAGTGVLTRALAAKLPPTVSYMVTDLNQPMLGYAVSSQGPDSCLTRRKADALALPFDDKVFDLVLCQFGAIFFPNRIAGYWEARRVLKPGGHFLFNSWDRIEDNESADDVTNAVAKVFPEDPPRFLAHTPHGYHDTELIHSDLANAGFSHVTIETRAEQSRAPSPRLVAMAYCRGTPLSMQIESRDTSNLEAAINCAEIEIAKRHGSGEVAAKIQAHVVIFGSIEVSEHTRAVKLSTMWSYRSEGETEIIAC